MAAQRKTNWFAIGVSIAVVVVLVALGGFVVYLNNQATSPGAAPTSNESFDAESGAISFGDGKDEVAVFVDFQCPACKSFEDNFGSALEKAAEDGRITLAYHPIAILDRFSQGTEYSSRSAGAAVCVASTQPDKYLDFSKALFANQPEENTPGLTDEQIVDIAKQAGADKVESCITDQTYMKFGAAQAKKHEIKSTPTVKINGKELNLQDNADFKKLTDLIS
ncbi:DsbA family protein [Microbacterium sp. KUDC0406]|uniref:DsbA family protein n=1 Tax=Microbacterium sp. KUDC0406 TaxID=2909588 RepID=UPI001F2EBC1C|nr:thioredoxin domain-containing protein [Microbacterium sp. KUDC0406]UJP10306.1 DsbA family protein [Microbacterium sp. KUDC0406]